MQLPNQPSSTGRQIKKNLPATSNNLSEIEQLRRAELIAQRNIENTKGTAEKIIEQARKEGAANLKKAERQLKIELSKHYDFESNKVKEESKKIVSDAKAQAAAEKKEGSMES